MIRLIRVLLLLFVIAGLVYANGGMKSDPVYGNFQEHGGLFINFHVPKGKPIFRLYDIKPGDIFKRNIDIINKGNTPKKIFVEGRRTGGASSTPKIETALDIAITKGVDTLYGPKKLSQFFRESKSPTKVFLDTINPGAHKTYVFRVRFPILAGNEFQEKSVIFDLKFSGI